MYMDIAPVNHELDPAQERDTVILAAVHIATVIGHAPPDKRPELVQVVGEALNGAGVAVKDLGDSVARERTGARHPTLTHDTIVRAFRHRYNGDHRK